MKRALLLLGLVVALLATPLTALAAAIQDGGSMFSQSAKSQAGQLIDSMQRRTGKQLVVYTVSSLNGQNAGTAARTVFNQQRINGVLFFMSKGDRQLELVIGQDTQRAIPPAREDQIRNTILTDFRSNKFDQGLIDGVNAVNQALPSAGSVSGGAAQSGPNWVVLGLLIVLTLVVVWVIGGIMRARRQPYFSYGQQPPSGPGYGAPGYGPGLGYGGGGGFFSGLLGGLGGALLGNALFDAFRPRDRYYDNYPPGGGYDAGSQDRGWQGNDAGQVGDVSGGSWGDPGGGDAGSGGDAGGGDSGGGDSGGSW